MFIGAWRRSQKPRWSVEARVTAVESHISSVGKSVVDMADRTAHVANGWATHEEIVAVRGKDPETQAAHVGACEHDRRSDFSSFADRRAVRPTWRRVWLWSNYVSRFLTARGDIPKTTEARGRVSSDRISKFWSREVVEHVCGFGFVRQCLDLRRSDKLSHDLLGLRIWIQQWAMAATRCYGV